jgi:uncharacterized protein YbjT (DUF2867 family)
MILITGASGSVGGAVLREVAASGAEFRAMYRSKDDAAKAPAGTRTVIADFSDRPSLERALEGIERVYIVCSPVQQLVELESNIVDACAAARIKHVVLNSALGAGDYPKSFPSWHRKVEDKLKSSGLSFTIIRPNSFHQNIISYIAPSVRAQGVFYSSIGDSRMSYIDVRDIAVVIAGALRDPAGHLGKTYELNGPEALTQTQIAEKISRACGRVVKYIDIPVEAQRKAMLDQGMPEWQVNALLDLQAYYMQGNGGATDGLLQTLLKRPPITVDDFLAEFRDAFRDSAARA